ncbi:hypothetical protein MIR68_010090 [Amoeboaphelidium protococcarum]|nr:hypothetical protein MIR68_010090 [Amoeboaphelidium protococcarum]
MKSLANIVILRSLICTVIDGQRVRRSDENSTPGGTTNQTLQSPPSPIVERAANPVEQPAPRSSSRSTGKPADSSASNSTSVGAGNQAQSTRSLDDCMAAAKYNECRKCLACPPGATCPAVIPPECDEIRRQCERYSQGSGSIPPAYRCNTPPKPSPTVPRPMPVSRAANPTETPPSRPITERPDDQVGATRSLSDCLATSYQACIKCRAGPLNFIPPECEPLQQDCEDYSKGLKSRPPAYRCDTQRSDPSPTIPRPGSRPDPSFVPMPVPVNDTTSPPRPRQWGRRDPRPSPVPTPLPFNNGTFPTPGPPSSSPQSPQSNNFDAKLFADCEYEVYQACMECHSGNYYTVQAECGPRREQCSRASAYLQPVPPPFVCPRPVERSPRPPYPPAPSPDTEAGRSESRKFYIACLQNSYQACQNCFAGPLSIETVPECSALATQCDAATRGTGPVPPPYACRNFPTPPPPPPRPPLAPPQGGYPDHLVPPPSFTF